VNVLLRLLSDDFSPVTSMLSLFMVVVVAAVVVFVDIVICFSAGRLS
jgi:hypothetical protein